MDEPQAPLTEALSDLERVVAFLDGSAKLEGSWYSQPSKHNAPFWWRINLREAMGKLRAALASAPHPPSNTLGDASGPRSLSLRSDDRYRDVPTSEASRDL